MKVWIIYDSKSGHCKKLAETLEDLLESVFDVSVGYAKKISPNDVLMEAPDAVLVGGPIHFGRPSRVITSWIKGCFALIQSTGSKVKKTFAFTTWSNTVEAGPLWEKLLQQYPFALNYFPQVLAVKIHPQSESLNLEFYTSVEDVYEDLRRFLLQ